MLSGRIDGDKRQCVNDVNIFRNYVTLAGKKQPPLQYFF
jgi:hypothetical protein